MKGSAPRTVLPVAGLRLAVVLAVLFRATLPSPGLAQENLADLAPFREGCQALADERFETAVNRFRECWSLIREGGATGPEANFVAARLLEAMVRNGAGGAAVEWLGENEGFQPDAGSSLWIAAAYQAEERFAEAAEHYLIVLSAQAVPDPSLLLNRAICLSRGGQPEAAHELVKELKGSSPEEVVRLAQIAASAGKDKEALAILESAETGGPGFDPLRLPLARIRASLLLRQGNRPAALAAVYEAVSKSVDAEAARKAFLLLEVVLENGRPEGLSDRLEAWSRDESFPGRDYADLYRHLLFDEEPARTGALRRLAATATDPTLRIEAALRLPPQEAPAATAGTGLAEDLRERIEFRPAATAYREGRFREAMERFSAQAGEDPGDAAGRDLFNAALAALREGDVGAYVPIEEALQRRNPRSGLLADLSYLAGLSFAAKGDPAAFDRLNRFVQEHPGHPAHVDARLALAEIQLNQAPARPKEAREIFELLRTRPLTLSQSERLDYAAVWAERIDGDSDALLRRAEEFVANWPGSPHLGEILMILAAEHYARKNLGAAEASFRRIAAEFPESPYAGLARFFGAKASPPSEETVAKWRGLIEEKGPFANEAAHELGLLLLSLDRFDEARAEFDRLLERLPSGQPLRFAVMADLAYASYLEALAAGRHPDKLTEAAERFAALASLEGAPPFWRYNAAVRRGKCVEALGKPSVALEIYRSIVEETRSGQGEDGVILPPEETDWVFRAGFAAIEILNAGKDWAGAIDVADALAGKSGPRAIEATQLAEKLRLKHWVWD
jgi:tetratricopeptide (TPR) repeat protein